MNMRLTCAKLNIGVCDHTTRMFKVANDIEIQHSCTAEGKPPHYIYIMQTIIYYIVHQINNELFFIPFKKLDTKI